MVTMDVQCPIDGCTFLTGDVSEVIAVALINTHAISLTSHTVANPALCSGPKLERQKVNIGVSMEQWNIFERRCNCSVLGLELLAIQLLPSYFSVLNSHLEMLS